LGPGASGVGEPLDEEVVVVDSVALQCTALGLDAAMFGAHADVDESGHPAGWHNALKRVVLGLKPGAGDLGSSECRCPQGCPIQRGATQPPPPTTRRP